MPQAKIILCAYAATFFIRWKWKLTTPTKKALAFFRMRNTVCAFLSRAHSCSLIVCRCISRQFHISVYVPWYEILWIFCTFKNVASNFHSSSKFRFWTNKYNAANTIFVVLLLVYMMSLLLLPPLLLLLPPLYLSFLFSCIFDTETLTTQAHARKHPPVINVLVYIFDTIHVFPVLLKWIF